MVHVRPAVSTVRFIAALAAMLVTVSTYGNDLPPLLSPRAFPDAPGAVSLTSATLQRQPFAETPEPLFTPTQLVTPTQLADPWEAALPDRTPGRRSATAPRRDHEQSRHQEPRTIHHANAAPQRPDRSPQEQADRSPQAAATDTSPSLEDHWASDLEQATFNDGLAVDILGIVQWTLIVLILCAVCCVVIFRRMSPNGPKRPAGTRRIRVLETTRIAAGSSLQLVEIDSHRFLVAVDGSGVRSVTGLPQWFDAAPEDGESSASNESHLHLLRSQPSAADPAPGKAA